jgi:poly-beta-1,6-N-acetyl-D-glucosamine synthase
MEAGAVSIGPRAGDENIGMNDTGMVPVLFWAVLAVWAYSLIGYPYLMRLVGRRYRPGEELPEETLPSVTLIIPAHNEEGVIGRKIENSLALDYPKEKLEILVASDGSTDETVELVRRFESSGVRLLDFPQRRGKTETVNDAISEAHGDVLAMCDANVMFRGDGLRKLVARLADPHIGAVSGDVRLASEESDFGQGETAYYGLERPLQLGESHIGSMMGVDGGMYVIRRELYERVPSDTIVDDFVISMRVIRQGKRVVYEPHAVAYENGTPRAADEFSRRVRLSAGAMQALKRGDFPPITRPVEFWQFVSHKLLRWCGPLWMVLLVVLNVFLLGSGTVYQLLFAGQVTVWGMCGVAVVSLPLRRTRIGGMTFYFVMSHVAMAVGLMRGLFDRQRVTWPRTERSGQPHSKATSLG